MRVGDGRQDLRSKEMSLCRWIAPNRSSLAAPVGGGKSKSLSIIAKLKPDNFGTNQGQVKPC